MSALPPKMGEPAVGEERPVCVHLRRDPDRSLVSYFSVDFIPNVSEEGFPLLSHLKSVFKTTRDSAVLKNAAEKEKKKKKANSFKTASSQKPEPAAHTQQ